MNISLPPQMARFIRNKVEAGDYTNASEVVRDAVRHMQDADRTERLTIAAELRDLDPKERKRAKAGIQRGLDDLEAGRYREFDEGELRAHFEGMGKRLRKRITPVPA